MKNILLLFFFLSFSTVILAQEHNDHLFFLETDSTWRKELFVFPIRFAQDIKYQGVEDARFPVGWEEKESPNFWSYAFGWNIENGESINELQLELDLKKYFNGLMRWDSTAVEIIKTETLNNEIHFQGFVNTKDAFFTKEPMTLNLTVKKVTCPTRKNTLLLFKFSPQSYEHDVWKTLEEVILPECKDL